MKMKGLALATLAMVASTAAAAEQITQTYDFSAASQIVDWTTFPVGGNWHSTPVVANGVLKLGPNLGLDGNSVIQLPIDPDIDRSAGPITITADVTIFNSLSDFDIFALHSNSDTGLPWGLNDNGYNFHYRTWGSDDIASGVSIRAKTGGADSGSAIGSPGAMNVGVSATIVAQINPDGTVVAKINGAGNQIVNAGHVAGHITLRSWGQVWVDNLTISYSLAVHDDDSDGVDNDHDFCAATAAGASVDAQGCSGVQLITQACPTAGPYRNHGAYVSCVSNSAEDAVEAGLLTDAEADVIISTAAKSTVGMPPKSGKK